MIELNINDIKTFAQDRVWFKDKELLDKKLSDMNEIEKHNLRCLVDSYFCDDLDKMNLAVGCDREYQEVRFFVKMYDEILTLKYIANCYYCYSAEAWVFDNLNLLGD